MAVVGEYKRVDGYGSGNELDGYNKIQAKNDAKIKRNTRGFETGILDMSFLGDTDSRVENAAESFQLTATNTQNITLGRGIATCYGFDLVVEELKLLDTISAPAVDVKYVFIFLEWDLSDPDSNQFNIGMWDNGTGSSWTPASQDNLANIPNGRYQLPIYRLTIATNGNVTSTQNYATLGVVTYRGVQEANYAQTALKYDTTDTTTAGSIAKAFKETNTAVTANKDKLATYDHTYLSLTLWSSTDSAALVKNGKIVTINHSATVTYKGTLPTSGNIGTISNNSYLPKKTITAIMYINNSDETIKRAIMVKIYSSGVISIADTISSTGTPNTLVTYLYYVYLTLTYEVN